MKNLITILLLMLSIACNAQSLKYNIFTTNTPAGFTNSVGLQVTTNGGVFGLSLLIAPGTGITFTTNSSTITISNSIYGSFLTLSNTVSSNTANIATVSNSVNTLSNSTIAGIIVEGSLTGTTNGRVITLSNPVPSSGSSFINPAMAGGRLTLVSGQPVVTTNATNSIIYYEPYNGNAIALLSSSGTAWATNFPSLSLNLTNIGGVGAGTNIDFFVGTNSSGVLTLTNTLWSSDTARAVAISQTNGVWVISTNIIWRYVGTARTDTTNQMVMAWGGVGGNGVPAKLFVWNQDNRIRASAMVADNTDSWTFNSTSWRNVNNSTSNRISCVIGQNVFINATATGFWTGTAFVGPVVGIGLNATNAPSGIAGAGANATSGASGQAVLRTNLSVGFSFFQAIEKQQANSATVTSSGDNGIANNQIQGLTLELDL